MVKEKPHRKESHPTFFVHEGSIRCYEEGSMLELYSQITPEEWILIVGETIKYKVFIDCLKEIACPILEESWTKEDDYFRYQLEIAVSRMRNIDALLVAKFHAEEIKKVYSKAMKENAVEAKKAIEEIRQAHRKTLSTLFDDSTTVSDL